MGNEESKILDYTSKGLEELPADFVFPKGYTHLSLSNNRIKNLPPNLLMYGIHLRNNKLSANLQNIASSLKTYPNLRFVDLSYNSLMQYDDNLKDVSNLMEIDLTGNKLTSADVTNDKIAILNLSLNRFSNFPQLPPTLKKLHFNSNRILKLTQSFVNLVELSLSQNGLIEISENLLFPNLKVLDVSKNKLKTLPDFEKITPQLEFFNIKHNLITEVPNLPKTLNILILKGNQIAELPEMSVKFPNLAILNLSNNVLKHIPKLPSTINEFYCQFNHLTSIASSNLPNIKLLNLSDNELTELPKYTFSHLEAYHIYNNKISIVHADRLSNTVKRYRLSNNQISQLPAEIFSPNVCFLDAACNRLRTLPDSLYTSNIKTLILTMNPFGSLPVMPPSLENLVANFCNLSNIEESLAHCSNLHKLYLTNNKLTSIPKLLSLEVLRASRNNIVNFPELPPSIKTIDLPFNKIRKLPTDENANFPELVDFDVSFNFISIFPSWILQSQSLKYLKIAFNKFPPAEIDFTQMPRLTILDIDGNDIEATTGNTVHQIITSNDTLYKMSPVNNILKRHKSVGVSETTGMRETMEDSVVINYNPNDISTFGVFDGHSGDVCSKFATYFYNLEFENVKEIVRKKNEAQNNDTKDENQINPKTSENQESESINVNEETKEETNFITEEKNEKSETNSNQPQTETSQVINPSNTKKLKVASRMSKTFLSHAISKVDTQLRGLDPRDGSTAVLTLLNDQRLIIANLGDSGAVLISKTGEIMFHTCEHRPENGDEVWRIKKDGGFVAERRVGGVLAVSRCLGDFYIPGVGKVPDIVDLTLTGDEKWLILACDGLFDYVSDELIVRIGLRATSPTQLAFDLRNLSLGLQSSDNISVIAIDLVRFAAEH
ncbi:leucine-rich repeat-containing protein [Tritrichomonas foetus]|uniref:Leucine-rich repeat-containing protein n=1 Tax=Tritrichomonas foetus TaxID=1144522 RepID=A0A1J4JMH8_9EUKA|nr:leucine-rich repeat-containing protein [Tritrichomonas foetus]|eukprot:OHS98460.1 leucine-rich repeat-containing protein [Tritrichomonas foetus]